MLRTITWSRRSTTRKCTIARNWGADNYKSAKRSSFRTPADKRCKPCGKCRDVAYFARRSIVQKGRGRGRTRPALPSDERKGEGRCLKELTLSGAQSRLADMTEKHIAAQQAAIVKLTQLEALRRERRD